MSLTGICCHCLRPSIALAVRQVVLPDRRRIVEEWCLRCWERESTPQAPAEGARS